MSCVVGLKSDKGIIMGADSAALMGNYIMSSYKEKIFIKDNFVYGACGLVRQSQVLRCYFSEPPIAVGQDIESYLVGPYSVALGDCLRECGLLEKPLQADPGEASKYTGVELAMLSKDSSYYLASMQMIPALNAMIDITSTRWYGALNHVPETVIILLFVLACACAFYVGYSYGNKDKMDWIEAMGFIVLTSMVS